MDGTCADRNKMAVALARIQWRLDQRPKQPLMPSILVCNVSCVMRTQRRQTMAEVIEDKIREFSFPMEREQLRDTSASRRPLLHANAGIIHSPNDVPNHTPLLTARISSP